MSRMGSESFCMVALLDVSIMFSLALEPGALRD